MASATCNACNFFDKSQDTTARGLCRFNPPMANTKAELAAFWPTVEDTDWCGHFATTDHG